MHKIRNADTQKKNVKNPRKRRSMKKLRRDETNEQSQFLFYAFTVLHIHRKHLCCTAISEFFNAAVASDQCTFTTSNNCIKYGPISKHWRQHQFLLCHHQCGCCTSHNSAVQIMMQLVHTVRMEISICHWLTLMLLHNLVLCRQIRHSAFGSSYSISHPHNFENGHFKFTV